MENTEPSRRSRTGGAISYFRRLVCFSPSTKHAASVPRLDRGVAFGSGGDAKAPTHLVVMVNGIIGSASDWKYAAKQLLKRFPDDIIVHRSRCNYNTLTFDGVDVMGKRLAQEVLSVANHCPEVTKISFIAHSLGGLIARYAIAVLYKKQHIKISEENRVCNDSRLKAECLQERTAGKIAGLEPMNFITFATPHLGSRWRRQIPFLCGIHALEKGASRASWILGRTGEHLSLNDHDDGRPPLLFQMISDNENLNFISALQSFRRRVAYSNARFDTVVGWKTSSIRRQSDLPKRQQFIKSAEYPYIIHTETSEAVTIHREVFIKEKLEFADMEEEMIQALNGISWERVDVIFEKSIQRFMAHSTIQVQSRWQHSHGAHVIRHMIDHLKI